MENIKFRFRNSWKTRQFVYWLQFSIVTGWDATVKRKSIRFFFCLGGLEFKVQFFYGKHYYRK
jgi:hypothetical protein